MCDDNSYLGVSVIMPAYNAEKTIGKAIESALAQTHPKLELIIMFSIFKNRVKIMTGKGDLL